MDEHRYARMQLHKLVADLWWSIWAMIRACNCTSWSPTCGGASGR